MRTSRSILLTALVGALAACGGGSAPADPPKPAAEAKRESVFDPLVGTIDRAKNVQNTVNDQAAEQRRRLEEAER
jgi:hypothetical protein